MKNRNARLNSSVDVSYSVQAQFYIFLFRHDYSIIDFALHLVSLPKFRTVVKTAFPCCNTVRAKIILAWLFAQHMFKICPIYVQNLCNLNFSAGGRGGGGSSYVYNKRNRQNLEHKVKYCCDGKVCSVFKIFHIVILA